jgi:hypothetical protein
MAMPEVDSERIHRATYKRVARIDYSHSGEYVFARNPDFSTAIYPDGLSGGVLLGSKPPLETKIVGAIKRMLVRTVLLAEDPLDGTRRLNLVEGWDGTANFIVVDGLGYEIHVSAFTTDTGTTYAHLTIEQLRNLKLINGRPFPIPAGNSLTLALTENPTSGKRKGRKIHLIPGSWKGEVNVQKGEESFGKVMLKALSSINRTKLSSSGFTLWKQRE